MSEENQVQVFGGTDLLDRDTLEKQLAVDAEYGERSSGVSYMSFSGKRGLYKVGIEGRAPGESEPFLVAIPLFKTGYICWKGGRPVDKRMAGPRDPRIAEPDMNEHGPFNEKNGEGWSKARSMAARSLENGEEIEFTVNTKSGVAVIADLHKEIRDRLRETDEVWPVITFGMEEFEAQGNRNFKPTLNVIAWLTSKDIVKWQGEDFDAMTLLDGKGENDAPAPAPRKQRNL